MPRRHKKFAAIGDDLFETFNADWYNEVEASLAALESLKAQERIQRITDKFNG